MLASELTCLIDHYLLYLHYHESPDPLHARAERWTILGDLYTLIGAPYPQGWHPQLIACMKQIPTGPAPNRWECDHHEPPVLLGIVDEGGAHIKVRDRVFHFAGGQVRTTCPRCGRGHSIIVPAVQ